MENPYPNDQAHIAEEFQYQDEHITQTAQLAYLKINSYKLSLINAAFSMSREELASIIRSSLFNYIQPESVLSDLGFFKSANYN